MRHCERESESSEGRAAKEETTHLLDSPRLRALSRHEVGECARSVVVTVAALVRPGLIVDELRIGTSAKGEDGGEGGQESAPSSSPSQSRRPATPVLRSTQSDRRSVPGSEGQEKTRRSEDREESVRISTRTSTSPGSGSCQGSCRSPLRVATRLVSRKKAWEGTNGTNSLREKKADEGGK